jgi:hypothetical protein
MSAVARPVAAVTAAVTSSSGRPAKGGGSGSFGASRYSLCRDGWSPQSTVNPIGGNGTRWRSNIRRA